jgi:hypothetical protein
VTLPTWIQTAHGRVFDLGNPRPEDIHVDDIAHHLANICRYTGACRRFYCPTPEQRILTDDLRWIPAGDLQLGDGLIGFDEYPVKVSDSVSRRHVKQARVTHFQPVRRRVIRLELSDGSSVRSSAEHPWLIATKQSRNTKWRTAEQIYRDLKDGRKRWLHRFFDVWAEPPQTREVGWLAGIYDGEGSIGMRQRRGTQISVAQKPGLVLSEIERLLVSLGFDNHRRSVDSQNGVVHLQLRGGFSESLRLLGTLRPLRLIENFQEALRNAEMRKRLDSQTSRPQVVAAEDEGNRWCTGIETSTHTYVCEGFGAHNSVAQHSCLVAQALPVRLRLAGLLHDAAEAYTGDWSSPLKVLIRLEAPGLLEKIHGRVERAVEERFGLQLTEADHARIKRADLTLLATEKRDLMPIDSRPLTEWAASAGVVDLPPPLEREIKWPWSFDDAKFNFESHFNLYTVRC